MSSRIRHELAARAARQQVNLELLERHHELQVFRDHLDDLGLLHLFDEQTADWAPFLRFAGPGHFYSPLPRLSEVRGSYAKIRSHASHLVGIDVREEAQLALFRELSAIGRDWDFPADSSDEFRYCSGSENFAFGIGDGLMLNAMLRHARPKRLIEVGSGFSSALALDTNERHLGGALDITFIEPYPELLLSLIGDAAEGACVLPTPVQEVDLSVFRKLEAGDILFVDTSHVSRFGSDVNDLFVRVIPSVAPGVIIHIHDIFWPFDYPLEWLEEGRAWNEPYVLRSFLQFNSSFEILLWNDWLSVHHRDVIAAELPRMLEAPGGSIWLRRTR